jgi:hypothetical protein
VQRYKLTFESKGLLKPKTRFSLAKTNWAPGAFQLRESHVYSPHLRGGDVAAVRGVSTALRARGPPPLRT